MVNRGDRHPLDYPEGSLAASSARLRQELAALATRAHTDDQIPTPQETTPQGEQ